MVPDAKQAAARVKKLGGQVVSGPMEVPGGDRIAVCLDPQGAPFAVHSVKPAAPRRNAAEKPKAKKPAWKKIARKPAKPRKARKAARSARKAGARTRPKVRRARRRR